MKSMSDPETLTRKCIGGAVTSEVIQILVEMCQDSVRQHIE